MTLGHADPWLDTSGQRSSVHNHGPQMSKLKMPGDHIPHEDIADTDMMNMNIKVLSLIYLVYVLISKGVMEFQRTFLERKIA